MPEIRRATSADLPAVAAIQADSPEAAQWNSTDYLDHEFLAAISEKQVAGFVVWRQTAPGEREILNLAVKPDLRRKGVARSLVGAVLADFAGDIFLEVRASNCNAQEFYKSMGFQVFSVREKYYHSPLEAAIVLKFHSC
jgi:ribosomal-protein-alanine N-acetyltransferase